MMRHAIEGAVVQKGIAVFHVVEKFGDGPGCEFERVDVDRQYFFDRHQAMVVGEDAAGHVAGVLDDAGAAGLHHRVGHLTDDRFEAARQHRKQGGIECRNSVDLARPRHRHALQHLGSVVSRKARR